MGDGFSEFEKEILSHSLPHASGQHRGRRLFKHSRLAVRGRYW